MNWRIVENATIILASASAGILFVGLMLLPFLMWVDWNALAHL